jgi:hypothetical protein
MNGWGGLLVLVTTDRDTRGALLHLISTQKNQYKMGVLYANENGRYFVPSKFQGRQN